MSRALALLFALAALAAVGCADVTDDGEDLGRVEVSLTGHSAAGTVYRLRHADLTVSGAGIMQVFHTEDDPTRSVITAELAAGAYSVSLASGWNLERVNADGTVTGVDASLLTANPLSFDVMSGAHTPVVLQFQAGADQVVMGNGSADISISVNDPIAQALLADPSVQMITEGSTGVIKVHLAASPATPVIVSLAAPSSAITLSPATLTFTSANFATPQSVIVTAVQDTDTNDESIDVTVATTGLSPVAVHLDVKDDDVQALVVNPLNLVVQETNAAAVSVNLAAQPAGAVTVNVVSSNPGAALVSPTSLTFDASNWNTPKTVTVSGVHDTNTVDDIAQLLLSSTGLPGVQVPVTVKDVDIQSLVVSSTAVTMSDASSTTFTVKLAFQPSGSLTVALANDNTTALAVSPTTLTFGPANFAAPQPVTLTAPNNLLEQTAHVTLQAPGVPSSVVNVTIKNSVFP